MSGTVVNFGADESLEQMRELPLIKKGVYHLFVAGMEDLINEQSQDNYGFKLKLQVLAGNVGGQEKKTFEEKVNWPSASHKDKGAFCEKKLKMLAKASGLIDPAAVGQMQIEWGQLLDMQFVAEVAEVPWSNAESGKSGHVNGIAGLKMFHIDDPEVANIPKHVKAVENCCGHRWTTAMTADKAAKLADTGKANKSGDGPAAGSTAAAPAGGSGPAGGAAATTPTGAPKPNWADL